MTRATEWSGRDSWACHGQDMMKVKINIGVIVDGCVLFVAHFISALLRQRGQVEITVLSVSSSRKESENTFRLFGWPQILFQPFYFVPSCRVRCGKAGQERLNSNNRAFERRRLDSGWSEWNE